jgi:hypothetical protein
MILFIEAVRNSALLLPSLTGIYVRISEGSDFVGSHLGEAV